MFIEFHTVKELC